MNGQLQLFALASDLVEQLRAGELVSGEMYGEDVDAMLDGKLEESKEPYDTGGHGSGVYDSMKANGCLSHISIVHGSKVAKAPSIWEGHHRLVSAAELGLYVGLDHHEYDADTFDNEDYNERYPQNPNDDTWYESKDV